MAKITLEEQPEFLTFPTDSILELKVDTCEVKTVNGTRGAWQKVEFKFKILGVQAVGDGSPVEQYDSMIGQFIYGSVPFRLTDSPENKLRQWAEALLGVELGLGFELDTDLFDARQVRGITSTYNGKNGLRHQVESLLPRTGGSAASGSVGSTPAPAAAPGAATQDPWGSATWNDEPPF